MARRSALRPEKGWLSEMAEKLILRGRTWYYRLTLADGRRVMRKGCPDRRETERMAAAAVVEQARIKAGLIDPREQRRIAAGRRPIAEHLDEFHAGLLSKGD